jgi:hypothetical protein
VRDPASVLVRPVCPVWHYTLFFQVVTGGVITLTPHDEADLVAYMKLLD